MTSKIISDVIRDLKSTAYDMEKLNVEDPSTDLSVKEYMNIINECLINIDTAISDLEQLENRVAIQEYVLKNSKIPKANKR